MLQRRPALRRRAHLARGAFPEPHLPGADADRRRSGASRFRSSRISASRSGSSSCAKDRCAPCTRSCRSRRSSTASSACRARAARRPDPLHQARNGGRHLRVAAVPRLSGAEPGRVPRAARQRHRGAGRGRGPGAPVRVGAEAAAPRLGDQARDRGDDAVAAAALRHAGAQGLGARELRAEGPDRAFRHQPADRRRPAGPQIPALCQPLPRAHPRASGRLLRRHPQEGHSSSITLTSPSTWCCSS